MFKRILSDSFSIVFHNLDAVFKACGAWFALQFIFMLLLITTLRGVPADQLGSFTNPILIIAFGVLTLIASSSIAVAWHRFALLGEQPSLVHLRVGETELNFLGKVLKIACINFLVFLPIWLILVGIAALTQSVNLTILFGIVLGLVAVSKLMRFNIALPATAIDHPMKLKVAYGIAKGLGWRMLLAMICLTVPIALLGALIDAIANATAGGAPGIGMQIKSLILNLLLQVITTVLGISVITNAFRVAMERDTQS